MLLHVPEHALPGRKIQAYQYKVFNKNSERRCWSCKKVHFLWKEYQEIHDVFEVG